MARTKSSSRWMQEHFDDEYVKMAQKLGYRSRAVFKLKEIQEKDHILKPGMRIVDLGAAPGGWSQYAKQILGDQGQIVALDILDIEPIDGVEFIQGDFREQTVFDQLMAVLEGKRVDLVMSDMAPNMSGSKGVDQPRSLYLGELALEMAEAVLAKDGAFLVKLFQGEGFENYCKQVQQLFAKVLIRKPKASRPRSNEVYLLARGFK
ncbi:MAG: 23S rRNA (uridine(2552)-2'-O)-methyltransferase RlmE [Methylococcaceae bacterium]|nr:23S rRNA (uridine(2552)-2'-O)-methyltransferase RlmE [Methylococcaceae bacterium]